MVVTVTLEEVLVVFVTDELVEVVTVCDVEDVVMVEDVEVVCVTWELALRCLENLAFWILRHWKWGKWWKNQAFKKFTNRERPFKRDLYQNSRWTSWFYQPIWWWRVIRTIRIYTIKPIPPNENHLPTTILGRVYFQKERRYRGSNGVWLYYSCYSPVN